MRSNRAMQITCPSCAAQYAVPDGKLAGRQVKCARCGDQWTPVPTLPPSDIPEPGVPPPTLTPVAAEMASQARPFMPAPAAPPAPAPRVVKRPVLRPSTDRPPVPVPAVRHEGEPRPAVLAAAWAASLAVLLALAAAAYTGRAEVMHAWPPSQRLYAAFGLR